MNSNLINTSLLQPENIMAVEIGESNVPEIKLVHFERSRKLLPDTDVIVTRLYEEIDFEGMCSKWTLIAILK